MINRIQMLETSLCLRARLAELKNRIEEGIAMSEDIDVSLIRGDVYTEDQHTSIHECVVILRMMLDPDFEDSIVTIIDKLSTAVST